MWTKNLLWMSRVDQIPLGPLFKLGNNNFFIIYDMFVYYYSQIHSMFTCSAAFTNNESLTIVFSLERSQHIIPSNCLGHSLALLWGLNIWVQCAILYTSFQFQHFSLWYPIRNRFRVDIYSAHVLISITFVDFE